MENNNSLNNEAINTLIEFVQQMKGHVLNMKSGKNLSDSDERYISGQELICSMVLQELDKISTQLHTNCFKFNLNEYIRVKVYDKGYQLMADNHNEYLGVIKNWEERDAQYYKNKTDENGYTKFQAWDFIKEFGGVTGLGRNGYYSNEILIDPKRLSVCR